MYNHFRRLSPRGAWLLDAGFTPSGSPHVWWDFSAIPGLADDDPIGTCLDQSGNGYDLTQATGANKPTFKTNIQNGLSVARWDGTADWMESDSWAAISVPFTIFIAENSNGLGGAAQRNFTDGQSGGGARMDLSHHTSGELRIFQGAGGAVGYDKVPTESFEILTASFNGTSSFVRINGSQSTPVASDPGSNSPTGMTVSGYYGHDAYWFDGDMGDIIFYDGDEAVANNEAGLKSKWNTP